MKDPAEWANPLRQKADGSLGQEREIRRLPAWLFGVAFWGKGNILELDSTGGCIAF